VSIAANSRWNLLGFGCTLAAHIVTVPVVIDHAGLTEFGRAGLVLAVWAPLFVGTVLGNSVVRLVSSSEALAQRATIVSTLNNALLLCGAAGAILILLVATLVPWLFSHIIPDADSVSYWRNLFLVAAGAWLLQQYSLVIQSSFAGERQFRTIAFVNVLAASATVGSTLLIVQRLPSGVGYLLGLACGFLVSAVSWLGLAAARHGVAAIRHAVHKDTLSPLVHFGKWQAVTFLAGNFANQIDRYVLGVIAQARVIGQFNAANRLQEAIYALVTKATEVLFPHFGASTTRSREYQLAFFLRANWASITFAAAALVPGIVLAHPLLTLWAGDAVANGGSLMLKLLLLGGLIGCASNVATYYFMGAGLASRVAMISIWYSAITILSSLLLLYTLGPYAAGGGIVFASVIRIWMSIAWARRDFGAELTTNRILASNILPLLAGCAIAAALEWTPVANLSSWRSLIATYMALSGLVGIVCAATLSLSREGRSWLRDLAVALRNPETSIGRGP
jgi:O-antigen/teichoic acid export membrane protein